MVSLNTIFARTLLNQGLYDTAMIADNLKAEKLMTSKRNLE